MTYHLQFLTQFAQELERLEETINLGAERNSGVKVKHIIETIRRVPHYRAGIGIPLLSDFARVHAVIERNRWSDVEILQHVECCLNRHRVTHAIAPVLDQALAEKDILLGCQRILELTIVAHLDFLIPAFFAHYTLALEWRRLAHVDGEVGERDGDG